MNNKPRCAVAICLSVAAFTSSMAERKVHAQTEYQIRTANQNRASVTPRLTVSQLDRSDPRFPALQKINELRKKLEVEQSNEAKRELESSLQDAIAEYFDRDMDHRRAELARLRKRTEATETLVSDRATAKEELVDLQLQAIANSAEGLGLFGDHGEQITLSLSSAYTRRGRTLGAEPISVAMPATETPLVRSGQTANLASRLPSVEPPTKERDSADAITLRQLREAYRVLRAAEAAEDRSMAKNKLRSALSEYFDADMEHRRRELQEIKKGLADMESRLEKREAAKEQIVGLQSKLFVNEAQGLGFFRDPERYRKDETAPFPGGPIQQTAAPRARRSP